MKKHSIEKVVRALSQKGVIITLEEPLKSKQSGFEPITKEQIESAAQKKNFKPEQLQLLMIQGKLLESLEITPKRVLTEVIVQNPFTVNTAEASNLGNKSWGKIDFLVNHQGFNLVKRFLDNSELLSTVKIDEGYDPEDTKTRRKKEKKKIHTKLSRVSEEV